MLTFAFVDPVRGVCLCGGRHFGRKRRRPPRRRVVLVCVVDVRHPLGKLVVAVRGRFRWRVVVDGAEKLYVEIGVRVEGSDGGGGGSVRPEFSHPVMDVL